VFGWVIPSEPPSTCQVRGGANPLYRYGPGSDANLIGGTPLRHGNPPLLFDVEKDPLLSPKDFGKSVLLGVRMQLGIRGKRREVSRCPKDPFIEVYGTIVPASVRDRG